VELVGLELDLGIAGQVFQRHLAANDADDATVLIEGVIERISQPHTAGPGIVAGREAGITGQVLSHVAGDGPTVTVIPATGGVADIHFHTGGFVERLR